jgi:hypothetical protein
MRTSIRKNIAMTMQSYRNLKSSTIYSKVFLNIILDYVDLDPYFELNYKRRLMIRNITASEQKIGYNLNLNHPQTN